ncbi:TIGR02391 family protein [Aeromonas salmonicida]|uniref:TIGR02391 family protein n=1 Tax=Aeromonas salmonicida TaxID=645 RepID=UPI003D23BE58
MNGLQKRALQKKITDQLVDEYADDHLATIRSLIGLGGASMSSMQVVMNQMNCVPEFGTRNILSHCSDDAISQLAAYYNIAMPDLSGRFAGESEQDQWELRFSEREFHTEIITHSKSLFLNGHYVNAVHEACKAYIKALQAKSGSPKDGMELVPVLSPKGNVKFNAYSTESERNYQSGLEQISRGVVSAFRNPAAHDTAKSLDMSAIEALDMLSTVSLLLKALDKAIIINVGSSH